MESQYMLIQNSKGANAKKNVKILYEIGPKQTERLNLNQHFCEITIQILVAHCSNPFFGFSRTTEKKRIFEKVYFAISKKKKGLDKFG